MSQPFANRLRYRLLCGAIPALVLLSPDAACAQQLPDGGVVVAGSATIRNDSATSLSVVQSSQRAVINWNSFSISAGNRVDFHQDAGAAILNRVTSDQASVIAGALRADGAVYLVNPNGLEITASGLIDTRGGFVGSTLGIKSDDFMAGNLSFTGSGGTVRNAGKISTGDTGYVALLGGRVAQDGVIVAPRGRVALGAGSAATLDLNGGGFLQILAPADDAMVSVTGQIQADGGLIAISAMALRDQVRETVNLSGSLRARSVSGQDGHILFSAGEGGAASISGVLDVSGDGTAGTISIDGGAALALTGQLQANAAASTGGIGGRIDVTADSIALHGATLSATGSTQGGLIRLGGAFQGGKTQAPGAPLAQRYVGRFAGSAGLPALRTAGSLMVDSTSLIDISSAGQGGTAILWSRDRTQLAGSIHAGNGAVEVSSTGKLQLLNLGGIGLASGGQLLLDPKDINIGNSAPADDQAFADSQGAALDIGASELAALLSTGVNVTLQASDDIYAYGSILVDNPNGKGGTLNLQAGRMVTVTSSIQTDDGDLNISANMPLSAGVVDADRDPGFAGIDLSSAIINAGGGNISLIQYDGAGLTNSDHGSIGVGEIHANDLTISNLFSDPDFFSRRILFNQGISVGGTLTLDSNLQLSGNGEFDFSATAIHWLDEATSDIHGEGATVRFIEDGTLTRLGILGFGSPTTRLVLGPDVAVPYSKTYGDADPAAIGDLLHIVSGDLQGSDTLADILLPDSLTFTGPGQYGGAGASHLTIGASSTIGFNTPETGYFIDLTPASQSLTITPKALSVSLIGAHYVYGAPGALASLTGLLAGDSVSLNALLNGTNAITLSDGGSGLTLSARTGVGSYSLSLTGLSGGAAVNYTLDTSGIGAVSVIIDPRILTYGCCNLSSTYGTAVGTISLNLNGILSGDNVVAGSTEAALSASGSAITLDARTHAGTYVLRAAGLSGADAGNYVLALDGITNPNLIISQLALTYIVGQGNVTYGNPVTSNLFGVLARDDVTGAISLAAGTRVAVDATHPDGFVQTGAFTAWAQRTNVGGYKAIMSGLTGANAGDYRIATSGNFDGVFSITPRDLSVISNAGSFVYGNVAVPNVSLSGLIAGDVVTPAIVTSAAGGGQVVFASNTPVGDYIASVSSISGPDSGNYNLIPGAGHLTITPRLLTWSLGATSVVYGNDLTPGYVTLSGIIPTDAVAGITGLVGVSLAGGAANPFRLQTDVGSYVTSLIGLTGPSVSLLANYTLASSGNTLGSLTITPRPLSYTIGSGSVVYGNIAPVGQVYTLTGFAGGEFATPIWSVTDAVGHALTLGASPARGAPDQVAAGTGVGTYHVDVTGLTGGIGDFKASNYIFSGSGGSLSITPRLLTYTIGTATGIYGSANLPGAALNGIFGTDDVSASGFSLSRSGQSSLLSVHTGAGDYTVSAAGLGGAAAGNYLLAPSGNTNGLLSIIPKVLSWTAPGQSSVYGNSFGLGSATLVGVVAGDNVSAGLAVFAPGSTGFDFDQCLAGNCSSRIANAGAPSGPILNVANYVLMASGLSGADAANYRLGFDAQTGSQPRSITPGVLSITPRPVTISLDPLGGVYGGSSYSAPQYEITSGNFVLVGDAPHTVDPAQPVASGIGIFYTLPPAGSNVGTYNYSAQLLGGALNNYSVTITPGTYTIDPLRLDAIVGNYDQTYGAAANDLFSFHNASFTGSGNFNGAGDGQVYNLNPGDFAVQVQASAINGRYQAGSYAINVESANPNYVIGSQTSGILHVSPAELDASGAFSFAFGDRIDLNNGLIYSGLLAGDAVSISLSSIRGASGQSAGTSHSLTSLWDSTGQPITLSNLYPFVGSYTPETYVLQGAAAQNYVLQLSASIAITPRPITVTGFTPINTIYGGAPDPSSLFGQVSYTNLVNGADATRMRPDMTAFDRLSNVGSYNWASVPGLAIDLPSCTSACMAQNYMIVGSGAAHVSVAPAPVNWAIGSLSMIYGTPTTLTATLSGVDPHDQALIAPLLGLGKANGVEQPLSTATQNGSSYGLTLPLLSIGDYLARVTALTGSAAGNYVLNPGIAGLGTISIAPRPLTYTTTGGTAYYGLPGSALAGSLDHLGEYSLANVLPGEQVGTILQLGVTDPSYPPGTAYTWASTQKQIAAGLLRPGAYLVTVAALTGANAENYVLSGTGNAIGKLTSLDFTALNSFLLLNAPSTTVRTLLNNTQYGPDQEVSLGAALPTTTTNTTGSGDTDFGAGAVSKTSLDETCGPFSCSLTMVLSAVAGGSISDGAQGQIGLDAALEVLYGLRCGDADCSLQAKTDLFVGARGTLTGTADSSGASMELSGDLGAQAAAQGGGAISGEYGTFGGGAGIGVGIAGGGISAEYHVADGTISYKGSIDFTLGIDIHLDVDFALNYQQFYQATGCILAGCSTSYQVPSDPVAFAQRQSEALEYQRKLTAIRQQQLDMVAKVLAGFYNDKPDIYAETVAQMGKEVSDVQAQARAEGFAIDLSKGVATVTDKQPIPMVTVTDSMNGLAQAVTGLF